MDRKIFFTIVRKEVFGGRLSTSQVAGMEFLLDTWYEKYSEYRTDFLAYALATVAHETDYTMRSVPEKGGAAYFTKMYDIRSHLPNRRKMARRYGNVNPGDGAIFYGRSYPQLTWRSNYAKMQEVFNIDLTSSFAAAEQVLEPKLGAAILFYGMIHGSFTGASLQGYFFRRAQNWVGARAIINGKDDAGAIAELGRGFFAALINAGAPAYPVGSS